MRGRRDSWVLYAALPFEIDFFCWENAVEMFVIYTLCCPIVFSLLHTLFCYVYVYALQMQFNGLDKNECKKKAKSIKSFLLFIFARFDFSLVS